MKRIVSYIIGWCCFTRRAVRYPEYIKLYENTILVIFRILKINHSFASNVIYILDKLKKYLHLIITILTKRKLIDFIKLIDETTVSLRCFVTIAMLLRNTYSFNKESVAVSVATYGNICKNVYVPAHTDI